MDATADQRWDGPGSLTLKNGWGRFLSNREVEVSYDDGTTERVKARYFLIATGTKPRSFPNILLDQQRVFNSDGILNLQCFPERLVIIGAGIIGCEYATIFSKFGQTLVYLVDHGSATPDGAYFRVTSLEPPRVTFEPARG